MLAAAHAPVMTAEVVEALNPKSDGIFVDATFGRGGHTRAILDRLDHQGRVVAIDRDPTACTVAREWATSESRLTVIQAPFSELSFALTNAGVACRVTGIVLDLGVSSPQLDDAERGFSFMRNGPLDMRMDPSVGISARQWLSDVGENDFARILRTLGEERYARRIARGLITARENRPLTTTAELAQLVSDCVPTREPGKHPATRTFQAVRMHINQELEQLDAVLPQALDMLEPTGRLVVISFHSLEDRRVKHFLREAAQGDPFPPDLPVTHDRLRPTLARLYKPTRPSAHEIEINPRARSAILRCAEKSQGTALQ